MKKSFLIALTALVFFGCTKDEEKLDFLVGTWESVDKVQLPVLDVFGDTLMLEDVRPIIEILDVSRMKVKTDETGYVYTFTIKDSWCKKEYDCEVTIQDNKEIKIQRIQGFSGSWEHMILMIDNEWIRMYNTGLIKKYNKNKIEFDIETTTPVIQKGIIYKRK
jgi:hypothetical protein